MSYIPESLRQLVIERAQGCCEYCRVSQDDVLLPHEIDHVIAEKHRGPTTAENLALSCVHCNRNKGSDISSLDPVTEAITPLFNPRREVWAEHFRLEDQRIVPLTAAGRVTEYLLRLNTAEQIERRAVLSAIGRYPCGDG